MSTSPGQTVVHRKPTTIADHCVRKRQVVSSNVMYPTYQAARGFPTPTEYAVPNELHILVLRQTGAAGPPVLSAR